MYAGLTADARALDDAVAMVPALNDDRAAAAFPTTIVVPMAPAPAVVIASDANAQTSAVTVATTELAATFTAFANVDAVAAAGRIPIPAFGARGAFTTFAAGASFAALASA